MFGWFKRKPSASLVSNEPLVIFPIPALVALLANREQAKGTPLTEEEVLDIRENAVSVALPLSQARQMAESRGYDDIDLEEVWQQWQIVRQRLSENDEGEQDEL